MMFFRVLFWLVLWIVTLGVLDIRVEYSNGLRITLNSWPRLLWKRISGGKHGR
jgi:hypothetical protein